MSCGDGGDRLVVGCGGGCIYVREIVKRRLEQRGTEMK